MAQRKPTSLEDGRGHHQQPRPDESIAALDHLEDHHAGVAALNEQRDAVAVLVLGEQLLQLARGGHVPAVDLENQVALLNPGLGSLAEAPIPSARATPGRWPS